MLIRLAISAAIQTLPKLDRLVIFIFFRANTQATGPPRSGAGVGVGMMKGAEDPLFANFAI